ncbi:MAG: hypothetical protein ABIP03_00560 [Aquihabitans sp.]
MAYDGTNISVANYCSNTVSNIIPCQTIHHDVEDARITYRQIGREASAPNRASPTTVPDLT